MGQLRRVIPESIDQATGKYQNCLFLADMDVEGHKLPGSCGRPAHNQSTARETA